MRVRVTITKLYDLTVPPEHESNPTQWAYGLQTTAIYEQGELFDVSVDHAEVVDDEPAAGHHAP